MQNTNKTQYISQIRTIEDGATGLAPPSCHPSQPFSRGALPGVYLPSANPDGVDFLL